MNEDWQQNYNAPVQSSWQGRLDGGSLGRMFQCIHCHDLRQGVPTIHSSQPVFGLIGFSSDAGVKRNLGRVGAKHGPTAFRESFGKLPTHFQKPVKIYDFGDILCENDLLEKAQSDFANVITLLLKNKIHPIAIGGGHEIAWAHYQGINQAFPQENLGIINFDAHFDLRELDKQNRGSSGTPFLQIAQLTQKQHLEFDYTCIGIQKTGNTDLLFNTANNLNVRYLLAEEIFFNNSEHCFSIVEDAINKDKHIYLTVCLDVFSESIAPGVSAPQCSGLQSWQVIQMLRYILASKKVISVDIAELCPPHDVENKTARLAAMIAYEILTYQL